MPHMSGIMREFLPRRCGDITQTRSHQGHHMNELQILEVDRLSHVNNFAAGRDVGRLALRWSEEWDGRVERPKYAELACCVKLKLSDELER